MRKALFASLIMAIWGSLVLSPASATGKAGTTCTRLNQKIESGGLRYTCIKSGKKLVWSKGIVVKKGSVAATEKPRATPAPTTAPTSAPIPTPNPASAPNLELDGFPSNIPAPGRSCPNVGGLATLYGAKLTCLKNESSTDGGKWVLNPGEVLVNPNVTPGATSPTSPSGATSNQAAAPSAIPLTISGTSSTSAVATANRDLNRPSIQSALTAIKDIQDTLQNAAQTKQGFQVLASPNVDATLVQLANKTLPTATKFFSSVYDPIKPVSVIYSYWSDIDWAVAADKAAGDTPNGYQSLGEWMRAKSPSAYSGELGSGSHTGTTVNGFTPKIILVTSGPDAANRPGGTTTAPHEYVHNVQQELAPTKFLTSPCWFVEGMAQYYAIALAYPDAAKFLDNRQLVLKDREFGTYPFDAQRTVAQWADSLVANEAPSCGGQGGYWIGPLAVEKLVSLKGTAGIIALTKEIERVGNFATALKNIYGMELSAFYALAAEHVEDTVGDLLGLPARKPTMSASPVETSSAGGKSSPIVLNPAAGTSNSAAIIANVKDTIAQSKTVPTSTLIHLLIEPGALTADQEKWLIDAIQFISYVSPPSPGGDWNLVFPRTMEWFLQNWDMSKEQQRYKDMFANNTAEQLMGSVHSYGTNNGGWAASFFVSPTNNWFNPDWQMRFMAQLLKPTGFANNVAGQNYPEWFTRMFAYPIGAAYSQLTSNGNYATLRNDWVTLLNTLPKPIDLSDYVGAAAYTGPENNKMPGALADEILIAKVGIAKSTNFLVEIAASQKPWDQQLLTTFGISKADLYLQVAAIAK